MKLNISIFFSEFNFNFFYFMSISVGWTKTKGSWEGNVKVAPNTFQCL
jgi:hypothetical protein